MTQPSIVGDLGVPDLRDQDRLHPVWFAFRRQQFRRRIERARGRLQLLQHLHDAVELRSLETRPDFAGVLQAASPLRAEDQRTEVHPRAAGIRPAADDELVLFGELQFQPLRAAPSVAVRRP